MDGLGDMHHGAQSLSTGGRLLLALAFGLVLCAGTTRGQTSAPPPAELDSQWEQNSPDEPSEWISPTPSHPDTSEPPLAGEATEPSPRYRIRHLGLGQPLTGTSWLNRPYYFGAFGGTWLGDTLIDGRAEQDSGFFGGYLLGVDLNHYWGGELRASVFYLNTSLAADSDSQVVESRNVVGDANVLYYPWGDSRWRPYGSMGLGIAGFHYVDERNRTVNHTGLSLPLGLGVKYLCRKWLAMRLDIKDNIVFGGNGLDATNNLSLVAGVEIHWGPKSSARYYPW